MLFNTRKLLLFVLLVFFAVNAKAESQLFPIPDLPLPELPLPPILPPPSLPCPPVDIGVSLAVGDPHFVSLDGHKFDFQGWGEFKFCEFADTVIHTCQEPVGLVSGKLTLHRGFVFKHKGITFMSRLVAKNQWIFVANGLRIDIAPGAKIVISNHISVARSLQLDTHFILFIRLSDGTKFEVVHYPTFLNIKLSLGVHLFGQTSGLCGNWDCDAHNDLINLDGILDLDVLAKVSVDPFHSLFIAADVDVDIGCSWGAIGAELVIPLLNRTAALACCLKTHPLLELNLGELENCILDVVAEGDEFTCLGELIKGDFCEECKPACSGNSHCEKNSAGLPVCVCDPGFSGADCSICDDLCSTCTMPHQECVKGVCVCKEGWTGKDCEIAIPAPCGLGVQAVASISGDPHVLTLDGKLFDFQGWGEFKFCGFGDTILHTCQEPLGLIAGKPTINRGFAFSHKGITFAARLIARNDWLFVAAGVKISIAPGATVVIGNTISITRSLSLGDSFVLYIRLADGTKLEAVLFAEFCNLRLLPTIDVFAHTHGICGNWDCNADNDLISIDAHAALAVDLSSTLFKLDLDLDVNVDIDLDLNVKLGCTSGIIGDLVVPLLNRTAALACCLKKHPLLVTNPLGLANCILDVVVEGDEYTCLGDLIKGEFCEECFPPCLGNSHCDSSSGQPKCVCDPGFSGPGCLICDELCASCNKPHQKCVNGVCICEPGFSGIDCLINTVV